ncbi:MAG TPA: peptidylprolyl isomerase [Acidimicrobiales bacterium]|nr:peptidylprolyl isomerase [Acidimicrobiales bacterium]
MPSEKRARKRAAREAKIAAMQRRQKRRSTVRRTVTVVVLVGIAAGIYVLVSSGSNSNNTAGKTGTSSTVASSTTSTLAATTTTTLATAQAAADAAAVAAGCPHDPTQVLKPATYTSAPAMTIDTSKTYTATVKTDVGTFVITFDAKQSPISVNNFVFLARKGFYNCVSFHRVIPDFVVQGGDPTGTGTGGPGYKYAEKGPTPAASASMQYPLGSVAMANSNSPATTDPTTNGSQFFIVTGANGESLPPDYTLFGQVTSGMNVVDQISADGSASGTPPKVTHRMLTVTIASS